MATPTELPTGDRTIINTEEQIYLCKSPIHLKLQNVAGDTTILSASVFLWVWNGAQNKVLGSPNFVLEKTKISASDNYINIPIGDQIRSYLENPLNAPNTFQPNFYYNEVEAPVITGQGVFWQIMTDITSTAGTVRTDYVTNFATLGYRWNYEQNAGVGNNKIAPNGSLGFAATPNKWYNPKIKNYISQSFNLTNSIAAANTGNMITQTAVTPPAEWSRQSRDPVLIVFLNKLGLWELFTPNGKFTASSEMDFETSNRSYRDPSSVNNSYAHSKQRGSVYVSQSYIINTGSLTEDMSATVEELLYSSKVYLIKFKGDFQVSASVGVTVDSTLISVDSINITVDSATVAAGDVGFYKSYQQIPVVITDSDFDRKTRVNDKNEINFNIKFDETNNKINNIR
jgi:hypothetical protein